MEPYLPSPKGEAAPYINVPPGETITITLVGTEPLGEDANLIKQIYATNLLKCQIIGFTTVGSDVRSEAATFGQAISEPDRKQLLEALE